MNKKIKIWLELNGIAYGPLQVPPTDDISIYIEQDKVGDIDYLEIRSEGNSLFNEDKENDYIIDPNQLTLSEDFLFKKYY